MSKSNDCSPVDTDPNWDSCYLPTKVTTLIGVTLRPNSLLYHRRSQRCRDGEILIAGRTLNRPKNQCDCLHLEILCFYEDCFSPFHTASRMQQPSLVSFEQVTDGEGGIGKPSLMTDRRRKLLKVRTKVAPLSHLETRSSFIGL